MAATWCNIDDVDFLNSIVARFRPAVAPVAIGIQSNVWMDPQGDVLLHYSRSRCEVYFGCWNEDTSPADYICKLVFEHAWAARGFSLEFSPYQIKEHKGGCVYVVQDSEWLEKETQRRLMYYSRWKTWDQRIYTHYFIPGHDNYYDIIASSFAEEIIPKSEAGDLVFLLDEY